MNQLREVRYCHVNIERHRHAWHFVRLEQEQRALYGPRKQARRSSRKNWSHTESESDSEDTCEPGDCAYGEPDMCITCRTAKRVKRDATFGNERKADAIAEVKDETTVKSDNKLQTKIEDWIKTENEASPP